MEFLFNNKLSSHIDSRAIIDAIDPVKDADGFHAINVGRNSKEVTC